MKEEIIRSSGNIFKDLGFEKPEKELAKAELAIKINDLIANRKLKQKSAAKILGVDQPKISALKNGRLGGFTIERLLTFLTLLDQNIEIKISPRKSESSRNIHVNVCT